MTVTINGTTGITAPGTETFGDGTALGGATNPIVSMAKAANNYVQSYIVNNTNGTSASADFVAYPSNGADAHGWVDMGITSLTYADTTYTVTGPNESYLFASAPSGSSTTGNLVIATDNTGTANSIQFYTNGFTQAKSAAVLTLDKYGSAGLGVTPSVWNGALKTLQLGPNGAYITGITTGWSAGGYVYVGNNGYYDSSWKYTLSQAAAQYYQAGDVHVWQNAAAGTAGGALTFVESMRVTAAGDLCVGGTTSGNARILCTKNIADYVFQAYNSHASTPYGVYVSYNGSSPNNTTQNFYYATDSSATRFYVRSNGGISNFSANNTNLSDLREKTNISLAGDYLAKICAIPVKTFNYVDQNLEEDDGLNLGVIAQDVQAVAPELVTESDWGTKEEPKMRLSIYQTDLQYALMKCIQEQQAIIEQLRADVETLKAK